MHRKLSRREFLTLTAGAGAATLLAACAPAAPEETAAPPTEAPPEEEEAPPEEEEAPTEVPAAPEAIDLELVYHFWPGWEEAMTEISGMYAEKTEGVTVTFNPVGFGDLTTAMTPRFAAQEPPDLIIADGQWPWTQQGQLIDLTPLIDRDGMDLSVIKDIEGGKVVADPAKGQYGLPLYLVGSVVFYNKALLDQYGVDYPARGWTLDDFREMAIHLTRDADGNSPEDADFDDQNIGHYGVSGFYSTMMEPFVKAFGGRYFDYDTLTCTLDDPKTIEAFTWINELACEYHAIHGSGQPALPGGADAFVSQFSAIGVTGDWMFSLYQTIEDFDWDVASIPEGPGGKWCYGASNTLGIPKDGQYLDESWDFLKYFVWEVEPQLIAGRSVGPALIDAALDDRFIESKQGERGPDLDNVRWAFEQMHENTTAEYYNMTRNSQQWNPVFTDLEASLLTLCDVDPAEALTAAAAEITEIIRKEPGEA